jgi:YebC/PmpR family DNA-binding regulatory protein
MSGHSKWAKIHRGKAVEDAKRGAVFTKLGNAVAIAAKNGDDPNLNFALRLAIDRAKQANMPAGNIQRAIDRGSGKLGGDQIQEVMYEGYGPGGSAILVECATDNINRTYPAVRLAFTKHGGNIAEKGAVAFQFERKGVIRVAGTGEEQLLNILESGAEDAVEDDGETVVYTNPRELAKVREGLQNKKIGIIEAGLSYEPSSTVDIGDKATAGKVIRLMEALDSIDDVSGTYTNFNIPDEFLE